MLHRIASQTPSHHEEVTRCKIICGGFLFVIRLFVCLVYISCGLLLGPALLAHPLFLPEAADSPRLTCSLECWPCPGSGQLFSSPFWYGKPSCFQLTAAAFCVTAHLLQGVSTAWCCGDWRRPLNRHVLPVCLWGSRSSHIIAFERFFSCFLLQKHPICKPVVLEVAT